MLITITPRRADSPHFSVVAGSNPAPTAPAGSNVGVPGVAKAPVSNIAAADAAQSVIIAPVVVIVVTVVFAMRVVYGLWVVVAIAFTKEASGPVRMFSARVVVAVDIRASRTSSGNVVQAVREMGEAELRCVLLAVCCLRLSSRNRWVFERTVIARSSGLGRNVTVAFYRTFLCTARF